MRSDLTPAFVAAKNSPFSRPRQWLVFKFPEAGPVYISDQKLGAADGLSYEYQALIMEWGELTDTVGDVQATESGEIRQASITLWNGGKDAFSNYFLAEYPENVEVELWQWFAGLAESDAALFDRFVIADPISFDEKSRLLNLDLVSMAIRYDQPCGDLLTKEEWPNAADSDIGKGIPLPFGTTGQIPTLIAKAAIVLSLKSSILSNTMTIDVYDDLDELNFPASGIVQIDEEKIRYSSRTKTSLVVLQRGYLSDAAIHLDKRDVVQVISDHNHLLCEGPVAEIAKVLIEGFPAPEEIYTVRPDLNPARIIFSEKPWVKKYASATRFLEMQFDGISGANTALQAPYAFDADDGATAAQIKPGNPTLALLQNTVNTNRGEILKAYLAVKHWESGNFLSDYVEVWVSGIGVVGRLSRPNPSDEFDLEADVNIDHPHDHETGGDHGHDSYDPIYQTESDEHVHSYAADEKSVQGTVSTTEYQAPQSLPFGPFKEGFTRALVRWQYTGGLNTVKWGLISNLYSEVSIGGVQTHEYYTIHESWIYDSKFIKASSIIPSFSMSAAHFRIVDMTVFYTEDAVNKTSAVKVVTDTSNQTPGSIDLNTAPVKSGDDVVELAVDNVALELHGQDNPSRTITNLFDITNHVDFDWSWFTGREIRITYFDAGVNEKKTVNILHALFDVEFVPTEIVFSDDVTAEVTGLAELTRPDQVVQHLLTNRADVAEAEFDTDAFNAIAAQYDDRGYRLDGLIDATLIVREAIKKICLQAHSRFFPSGGRLKMVLREGHPASKPVARQLTSNDNLQNRSISVVRQPLSDISNRIQLFFKRDWTASETDTTGYLDSVTKEDSGSIDRFGLKVRKDAYNFDLIRDGSMAATVADFYLMADSYPSSFYTFMAYLDQFDLEKEDVLEVSADFNKMNKVPMVLRAMDRIFGSAKDESINLLRIVAENFYYLLSEMSLEDQVNVIDTLTILIYEIGHFEDAVQIIEQLMTKLSVSKEDAVQLADTLMQIMEWKKELADAILLDEDLLHNLQAILEDTVEVDEFLTFYSIYGFGGGGFGQAPMGGTTTYIVKHPDQIYLFMQLAMVISAVREDTVVVSDELLMSSGFGGELSSGFGKSPFGR
jgi:hypothetical protein